jgi:type IV pilus assembly protein PilQ
MAIVLLILNISIGVRDLYGASEKNTHVSFHFNSIELREILSMVADVLEVDFVVSEQVSGSIALHLNDVPVEDALETILKSKQLACRREGRVWFIAPEQELSEQEKNKRLKIAYIPIRHARVEELVKLIGVGGPKGLLSSRGSIQGDPRLNIVIVQDVPEKVQMVEKMLQQLDRAAPQVLIEARLIKIGEHLKKELGLKWGLAEPSDQQKKQVLQPSLGSGMDWIRLPKDRLIHLELAALEQEGLIETISRPRLMTVNKKAAHIEQGQEIPFQESTRHGATHTVFKKAVFSLTVTPQITSNAYILLDLRVTNDAADLAHPLANGIPVINTQKIDTQVLCENGETIVLGGILTQDRGASFDRVPILGSLPYVGALFRKKTQVDSHAEFLIFITPQIVTGPAFL